jgi:ABC-type uncharacterized transport system ATPase subunit
MTEPARVIRTGRLVKTFGPVRALDGLDLEVSRGEVHGFLGPNGAGKSTTIRVLLGLVKADEGRTELFGGDPWHHPVARPAGLRPWRRLIVARPDRGAMSGHHGHRTRRGRPETTRRAA